MFEKSGVFTPLNTFAKRSFLQVNIKEKASTSQLKSTIKGVFSAFNKENQALKLIGHTHSGKKLGN